MPKRKEPELTPKEQFRRFVETAREHDVDETGKEFERAFKEIVSTRKKRTHPTTKTPDSS